MELVWKLLLYLWESWKSFGTQTGTHGAEIGTHGAEIGTHGAESMTHLTKMKLICRCGGDLQKAVLLVYCADIQMLLNGKEYTYRDKLRRPAQASKTATQGNGERVTRAMVANVR